MVIRNFAKCLLVTAAAVACTAQNPDQQAPVITEPVSSESQVVTVRFDDALLNLIEEELDAGSVPTKSAELGSVLSDLGIDRLERVFPDAGEFEERSRREGLHRFYTVHFRNDLPMTKAVSTLEAVPGIASVTPERKPQLRAIYNDPLFSRQWHYVNSSNNNSDINVKEVWEKYTKGSNKVIVCVVDEPVDPKHADLKDNLWKDASGHTGYNFARSSWDLTIRPESGDGDFGHGTHVAGTISAVNNNGIGVCGIAGGDRAAGIGGVLLQSCAIFSGTKSASDANTAKAIKWGADHGAVISQNSWGYSADGILDDEQDGKVTSAELAKYKTIKIDEATKAAIDYFIKYAGCDNQGNQLPDSPMKGGIVFFAAGNENIDYDVICDYEPVIAVGASGKSGGKASYSNYGDWIEIAAPGGDGSTNANSICSTLPVSPYISDDGYGGETWAGTSMACPHASGVAALVVSYFGGQGFTNEQCKDIILSSLGNTVGGKKPVGKHLDALNAFEYGITKYGNPGGGSSGENHPPVISLERDQVELTVGRPEASVKINASDPDGDPIEVSFSPEAGNVSYDPVTRMATLRWERVNRREDRQVVFTVTDNAGKTASVTLHYVLQPNRAPQVASFPDNIEFGQLQANQTLLVNGVFVDPDSEVLSCTAATSFEGIVNVAISGNSISVSALSYGVTEVTLTATDSLGESATCTFAVAVVNPQQPVATYPSVVSTDAYITIDHRNQVNVNVAVYSSVGSLVYTTTASASKFKPIHLDVSKLAPGRYTVELSYSGESHRVRMIKY